MVYVNKDIENIIFRIAGIFLVIVAIAKCGALDTSNFFTITWDLVLIFIVIGFGFSLISNKK